VGLCTEPNRYGEPRFWSCREPRSLSIGGSRISALHWHKLHGTALPRGSPLPREGAALPRVLLAHTKNDQLLFELAGDKSWRSLCDVDRLYRAPPPFFWGGGAFIFIFIWVYSKFQLHGLPRFGIELVGAGGRMRTDRRGRRPRGPSLFLGGCTKSIRNWKPRFWSYRKPRLFHCHGGGAFLRLAKTALPSSRLAEAAFISAMHCGMNCMAPHFPAREPPFLGPRTPPSLDYREPHFLN
jgi:hypothetical protein